MPRISWEAEVAQITNISLPQTPWRPDRTVTKWSTVWLMLIPLQTEDIRNKSSSHDAARKFVLTFSRNEWSCVEQTNSACVVDAPSVNCFKVRLDKLCEKHPMKIDYKVSVLDYDFWTWLKFLIRFLVFEFNILLLTTCRYFTFLALFLRLKSISLFYNFWIFYTVFFFMFLYCFGFEILGKNCFRSRLFSSKIYFLTNWRLNVAEHSTLLICNSKCPFISSIYHSPLSIRWNKKFRFRFQSLFPISALKLCLNSASATYTEFRFPLQKIRRFPFSALQKLIISAFRQTGKPRPRIKG